jgi:hypothetical protein
MPNAKETIRATTKLIEEHELGPDLTPFWNEIKWQECDGDRHDYPAELHRNGEPVIRLFPSLETDPRAGEAVMIEFAYYVFGKSGERGKEIWEKKLFMPTQEQMDAVSLKLASPELRKTCETYEQVLDTYPKEGHAVDRLVFLHVVNALIANNVPYPETINIDIRAWGPTAEYTNFKRYDSLVPLSSAYAPRRIDECFGSAVAAWIVNDLGKVRDKTVAYALKMVIRNVIGRAKSA